MIIILILLAIILILYYLFFETSSNDYYNSSRKQYNDLLKLKNDYEYIRDKNLYQEFYSLKNKTFIIISESYLNSNIKGIDRIKINFILHKIMELHLDISEGYR